MPSTPRQAIPERHQHPIAMLKYTYRYLFLLLFPLARGLRYIRSPQGLYAWVKGAWQDPQIQRVPRQRPAEAAKAQEMRP